jgi:hypothetical protein
LFLTEAFAGLSCRKAAGLSGIFAAQGKIADNAQARFRDEVKSGSRCIASLRSQ